MNEIAEMKEVTDVRITLTFLLHNHGVTAE
jgi:hypothetical protein